MIDNIYMIVAMTKNTRAIGIDGDMLYHLKEDLKYFKETTLNHTIVCGRKTYFSFPKIPIQNMKNIILNRCYEHYDKDFTIHSKEQVSQYALNNQDEKIFICGGDNVYKQFMDLASKLYITEIDEDNPVEADSFFPQIDPSLWTKVSESDYIIPEKAPRYKFLVYDRNL